MTPTKEHFDAQLDAIARGESHRHRKVIYHFQEQFLDGAEWAGRITENIDLEIAAQAAHHRLTLDFYENE